MFIYKPEQQQVEIEAAHYEAGKYSFKLDLAVEYDVTLNDQTPIKQEIWRDVKADVMESKKDWRGLPLALDLNKHEEKLVEALITAQDEQGDLNPLQEVTVTFTEETQVEFEIVLVDESCTPPEEFRLTDGLEDLTYIVG